VYRSTHTGGPYSKISVLQPATSYTDATVATATAYYYVVTALGMNSVESGFSNEAVAAVP
jgi:fibronectin type 3 domain-containing protein